MATVKDITAMCKAGDVAKAYQQAKADLGEAPQDVWAQREMGWALYYLLKTDLENNDRGGFLAHAEELAGLDLLTTSGDAMMFSNVLWKMAEFAKTVAPGSLHEMDSLFGLVGKYTFAPSKGYSCLLKSCLRLGQWERLADFIEWWNLDNLQPDDFEQYRLENGKKAMSLAEQAYIGYAKALLRKGDVGRISAFLPKIEKLTEDFPEMMYPGYFCGKLMLATGAARDDALTVVMPFARKKQSEFWIWQLLAEVYCDDTEKSMACLLRAVHCKAQESFLGKVRVRLASAYLSLNDYGRAKFHIEKTAGCYTRQGWRLPYEVQDWLKAPWMQTAVADSSDGLDYKRMTDAMLSYGTNESVAVVTHVDIAARRAAIVYGEKKRMVVTLRDLKARVAEGTLLTLNWVAGPDGKASVVGSRLLDAAGFGGNGYIKLVSGNIRKPADKPFAFIEGQGVRCFITPATVRKHCLAGNEAATAIAVYDYNKKRDEWSWRCASLKCKSQ